MQHFMVLRPSVRMFVAALAVFSGSCLLDAEPAFARGNAAYLRALQQMQRQSMEATQKYMAALEKQQQEDYKAFMARFDTNKNGKIDGKERGPANKYIRELELGLDPDAKLKKQQQATMKVGKKSSSKPKKSTK